MIDFIYLDGFAAFLTILFSLLYLKCFHCFIANHAIIFIQVNVFPEYKSMQFKSDGKNKENVMHSQQQL